MYLDNIQDEACRAVFSGVQYSMMKAIQEAGYTWGIWVHEGIAGGETYNQAIGSPGCFDETIVFWQFDTNMPVELLKRVMREEEKRAWEAQRCGHDWDCCGCTILYSFSAFRDMYAGETYTLVEKWGRNV